MFPEVAPNGTSHSYKLDQFSSVLKAELFGEFFFSFLFNFQKNILKANSGDSDRTPRFVASELGLHCLHMSNKKEG